MKRQEIKLPPKPVVHHLNANFELGCGVYTDLAKLDPIKLDRLTGRAEDITCLACRPVAATVISLGQLILDRGNAGLKTADDALARIERLTPPADFGQLTYTVVELPNGRYYPVVFLAKHQLYAAMMFANANVFVMGGGF